MEMLAFPSITAAEEVEIRSLLGRLWIVPLDDRVEEAAILIRRQKRLKLPDAIVVASAHVHGLQLLTFDGAMKSVFDQL